MSANLSVLLLGVRSKVGAPARLGEGLRFIVSALGAEPAVYLVPDRWNDWYRWVTQFTVFVVREGGERTSLGSVKIGKQRMTEANAETQLPPIFDELDQTYFSVGQSENYYETLAELGDEFRAEYLRALRDCAFDPTIFEDNVGQAVMSQSLLRSVPADRVRLRLNRLAHGNAVLTRYSFKYELAPTPRALEGPPTLAFDVQPYAQPPTNVHVLIGRNGVGKSRCFDHLTRTLLGLEADGGGATGAIRAIAANTSPFASTETEPPVGFAGLVTVAFSAFDNSRPFSLEEIGDAQLRYAYIGLKKLPQQGEGEAEASERPEIVFPLKTPGELAQEFVESVGKCRFGVRLRRWKQALETLEADPLFKEADVSSLADTPEDRWSAAANQLFRILSSGHGIVLLTVTRLVELVEERSLVLLDEPEGHLHPPLLSAFVRALSDLLSQRNGVAIVATHSPVVLQEVPKSCVWVLSRTGRSSRADRPEIETFGENVGVLTREVFGLEVTQSGFHRMVAEASAQFRNYDQVVARFGGNLGAEARGLARTLTLLPPNSYPEPDNEDE